jgi:hypothetical protein
LKVSKLRLFVFLISGIEMKMSIEHSWNDTERGKQNIKYWWNDTDRGKQNIEYW